MKNAIAAPRGAEGRTRTGLAVHVPLAAFDANGDGAVKGENDGAKRSVLSPRNLWPGLDVKLGPIKAQNLGDDGA